MTQKELADMFGVEKKKVGLKDKKKAAMICKKILRCYMCGKMTKWIEGTDICVCPNCIGSENSPSRRKHFYKKISKKSKKFLSENYHVLVKNKK